MAIKSLIDNPELAKFNVSVHTIGKANSLGAHSHAGLDPASNSVVPEILKRVQDDPSA